MANETTSTTVTEVIEREAYAGSVLYFAERPGVSQFVTRMDISNQPTLTARFPIYDKVSAEAIAENTDFTTNSAVDTSGSVDVTVSEHAVKFTITDLSLGASRDSLAGMSVEAVRQRAVAEGGIVGQMAAEALQRIQDQDIATLFASFNSSTGSNSGPLTSTLFNDALGQLNIDNIPDRPRAAVLHPKQWNALIPVYDDASTFGTQGAEVVRTGAVGEIFGVTVFQTANVRTATVSSSTVYAGAMMHPSAVALAQKGPNPAMEAERDASLRATEVIGTLVHGEAEYRGGATTSGRGGAGVYFYSNTTN